MDLRLGFLASNNGSNARDIIGSIEAGRLEASARVIISTQRNQSFETFASDKKIPFYYLNEKSCTVDNALPEILRFHQVNLIALCGYLKLVGENVIEIYHNRILNIHPSLLPKYGGKGMYGMKVHEAVIKSDDLWSGATVHLVNQNYDDGKILGRIKVPKNPEDTQDDLSERVRRAEKTFYPEILRKIQTGEINLDA